MFSVLYFLHQSIRFCPLIILSIGGVVQLAVLVVWLFIGRTIYLYKCFLTFLHMFYVGQQLFLTSIPIFRIIVYILFSFFLYLVRFIHLIPQLILWTIIHIRYISQFSINIIKSQHYGLVLNQQYIILSWVLIPEYIHFPFCSRVFVLNFVFTVYLLFNSFVVCIDSFATPIMSCYLTDF